MKFIVSYTAGTNDGAIFLQNIYELYVDYVLKVIIKINNTRIPKFITLNFRIPSMK